MNMNQMDWENDLIQQLLLKHITMLMDYLKCLWAEAIACAIYLYNRLPHRGIENKFPIQMLDGKGPLPVHYLYSFGCKVYIHIPHEARPVGSILQPRATEGIFIEYIPSIKIFRIYLSDKCLIHNS
jgi:hypothetical protein